LQEIQEDIILKPGLKIIVQENLPVLITERVPLLQVFTNLITNAIKYNDKEEGVVKISYQTLPDHYEFFIEDNGIGIDEKYHQKIFLIFQTLQEKEAAESTGVGLAIVKKILEDRHLKINIQSVPGEGSVFSFTWPKK
jgi:light-regulated signal transduction histidine kinase (bacteriophytochrome)